jgi:hypothetical protein
MTKQQKKQIEMVQMYLSNNMADTAARSVSALIRSAMSTQSRNALLAFAVQNNLQNHPDFII